MTGLRLFLKCIVTFSCFCAGQSAFAVDEMRLNELFSQLRNADSSLARDLEADIFREFSHSGSAAMDHLLERGQGALARGDSKAAVEHLTALIDHAPNFAEGYNSRATAFYSAGRYGLAMTDIAQTLALEPRHFGAMSGMSLILEELGQSNKALTVLREIETLHPNMAGVAQRIARLEEAVRGPAL